MMKAGPYMIRFIVHATMLSSSLIIGIFRMASAAYILQDDYTPSDFLNMFNFFDGMDPTQGYGIATRMASCEKR